MRKRVGYALLIAMLFIAMVSLSSCRKKNQSPPKKMVRDALLATLPPYFSLDSVELESVPTGPESAKVNFKAIVTPKEDLYEVDREVEGTPAIILLKVTQATGAKASFYGFFEASRTIDLWTLGSPQIGVGLQQFGSPRAAFPPHSYITGSDDANAALKEQAANTAEQERARKAAAEQQERERKARQEREAREQKERDEREKQARTAMEEKRKKEDEQQKKEDEDARQKLILATAAGTRYIGTISHGDEVQRLRLVFTEQEGALIRAEASNPDRSSKSSSRSPIAPAPARSGGRLRRKSMTGSSLTPQEKQTFVGELVFDPKPERGRPDVAFTIVMSPIGKQDLSSEVWGFYKSEGSLKLLLTDTGLEGEADMGAWYGSYTIRLQQSK
jgi:hypothetical protein